MQGRRDQMTLPNRAQFDVVVIGGGQAGLAVGYYLRQHRLRFEMLDAGPDVGHVWSSRWNSLKLFTPTQYSALPGIAFPGAKDTYPSRDDAAAYLNAYAAAFDLRIRPNARVTSLTKDEDIYLVATEGGAVSANQVVVATGPFQRPFVPSIASDLDAEVVQIHSAHYRNPAQLPKGRILVVGGGNSGFQIAKELAATRKVVIAVGGRQLPLPQRLLGHDLFWWLTHLGVMKVSVESRLGRQLSRRETLIGSNRRQLRRANVTIRKRLERSAGRLAFFADGSRIEVDAVVWATGYQPDFSWIDIPGVIDDSDHIVHRRGVAAVPGLYFVGLAWQHTRGSALLGFVKDDAAFIADTLVSCIKNGEEQGSAGRAAGPTDAPDSGLETR
jgi:putative flavoprotein involved in K+ transport